MRLRLDPDACTGHGRCYALDPESFLPDDLGHCELVVETPADGAAADRARRAVAACPERALRIED